MISDNPQYDTNMGSRFVSASNVSPSYPNAHYSQTSFEVKVNQASKLLTDSGDRVRLVAWRHQRDPHEAIGCSGELAFFLTGLASGCSAKRTLTQTPRSATEQLLLSTAAERSATQIQGPDFLGVPLYLEVAGLTNDAAFAKETVANELQARGAIVVTEVTKATRTVKILVQALGTDQTETFFGIPAMNSIIPIPEITLFGRHRQIARSRLQFTMIDSRTGQTVGQAQEVEGRTVFTRMTILPFAFEWSDVVGLP